MIVLLVFVIAAAGFMILSSRGGANSSDDTAATKSAPTPEEQAEEMLNSMTTEEKVGQMFMGCFYNGTPSPETVTEYGLGSVLLFKPTFTNGTMESVTADLNAIDKACDIAPIFAVDEEGGSVSRIGGSSSFRDEPFASPRELYDEGGMDAVMTDLHEKNALLSEIGIDLNLAPVCDISQNANDFMYSRSLGQDAETTSSYAEDVVKGCAEDGIGCCLKHFPGYGNNSDTHNGASVDSRTLQQLKDSDLLPFEAGIDAGAPFVLISHNIVTSIDDSAPASLSPEVHSLLRDDLGFEGIILTDDLSMGAISAFSSDANVAVTAILAGNDMLCTGDYASQYEAVLAAVESGTITEERIDESVKRILTWKISMSLI